MKMVFMIGRLPAVVAILASALLTTTACGDVAGAPAGSGQPGRLEIVVAAYPFQFIAERIAGSHAATQNLTEPGAEPHDVELTPRQVADISGADLVIFEKGFQPAVDEAVAHSATAQALDTTTVVPLQPLAADHDHGGLDPHVWLDPTKITAIAAAVTQRLIALSPERRTEFEQNLQTLEADLTELDQAYASTLGSCDRTAFITTHAAFGYLAARYGLTQIAITGLSPEAEPSPARIAAVQDAAREHRVTTIFYETLASPAVATSIAGDLGLKTDVLDPIEGITPDSRGSDYLAVMESNLTALKIANGCR
jgi:zinc transport system substrate-binding protein